MRDNGLTSEATSLSFQLLRNSLPYKASSVHSLAVYVTATGYSTGEMPVATINTSTGIVTTSTGLYSYTIPVIPTAGTYYDVIGFDLIGNGTITYFVNSFTIIDTLFSSSTIAAEPLCTVYGYVKSAGAKPVSEMTIAAYPDDCPAIDDITNNGITPQAVSTYTDDTGYFSLSLIQNIAYRIAIREMAFYSKIIVPPQTKCELWQLTSIKEIGEPSTTTTVVVSTSTGNVTTTTTVTSGTETNTPTSETSTTTGSGGTVINDPNWS